MLIYFLLVLIILFDFSIEYFLRRRNFLNNESKRVFHKFLNFMFKYRLISIAAMVFLSTFRGLGVGEDVKNYAKYYNELKNGSFAMFEPMSSKYEFGYTFLNSILAIIGCNFRILLFIIALFTSICFVLFTNKFSKDKTMSLLLYVMLGVFAQSLNTLRQIIAMALILLAVMKIYDKKWIWSSIFILLASSFHISALSCLIIIPFRFVKCNYWFILIMFICTIVAAFAFPYLLKILEELTPLDYYEWYMVKYPKYLVKSNLIDNLYSIGLICVFVGLFILFRYQKNMLNDDKEQYNYFLNLFIFVPLIRIAGFICNMQALFNRLSMYYMAFLIVLIPLFVKNFPKQNKKWKIILNVGVYVVAIAYMYYLYAIKLSSGVVPYVFGF